MRPATWIFGLCVAGAAASQQRATLLELYDATGGSGWANASGWATAEKTSTLTSGRPTRSKMRMART